MHAGLERIVRWLCRRCDWMPVTLLIYSNARCCRGIIVEIYLQRYLPVYWRTRPLRALIEMGALVHIFCCKYSSSLDWVADSDSILVRIISCSGYRSEVQLALKDCGLNFVCFYFKVLRSLFMTDCHMQFYKVMLLDL